MKTLRNKPIYKLYYRYKNINLWQNKTIDHLTKKKWIILKASKTTTSQNSRGIYLWHYKKLNLTRLYYYKFINKQLLKKYLVNYTETSFKQQLLNNFKYFEKRVDFNLYQANFVPSLYAARFLITKGYILVNHKIIHNVNYILKARDLVEINSKFFSQNFLVLNTKQIYNNHNTFTYLRNLEIDYTTLSFIFLDHSQFYIFQFENFVKKIYYNNIQKKVLSIYKTDLNSKNNFFKFLETTFNYYLFLDESNKFLKIKTLVPTNFKVLNLLKYLRIYYNDYFFRNILLKRIFISKYNYLYFLKNNNTFIDNNYKNIFTNLNILYNNTTSIKNNLQFEFYKYSVNILFKIYIYLLQNYSITTFSISITNFSTNNFNFILLNNKSFLFLCRLKTLLANFFNKNFINKTSSYIDHFGKNKYKLLNIKAVPLAITHKTNITWKNFQILNYYISSNRFKYKIYRKCHNFNQNLMKRSRLILHLRKAFNYRYYNQLFLGNSSLLYTTINLRNKLYTKTNKNINISTFNKVLTKSTYYPKDSNLYKVAYTSLFENLTITKADIQNQINVITKLINKATICKTDTFTKLIELQQQLVAKLTFFNLNHNFINFNYNTTFKDIFLLKNLITRQNFNSFNVTYNLNNLTYTILTKTFIKNNYLYHRYNEIYSTKRYHHFLNYFNQRIKINYFYKNNTKVRILLPSNVKKYFSIYKTKTLINSFLYIYNRYRKQRSKYFYKYLNKNINNNKIFSSIDTFNSNMNTITSTLEFNDNFFYIDLLLNLSVRKVNNLYNFTNNYIYSNNTTLVNINTNKSKKKTIFNKNKKNYLYKSYYPIYTYYNLKSSTYKLYIPKSYIFFSLKYNHLTNSLVYYYNYNTYNNLLKKKYFNLLKINKKSNQTALLLNKNKILTKIKFIQLFEYYNINIRKYNLIKYLYKNFIFKEYDVLLNNFILTTKNIKNLNITYIKQLYYNLLFNKIFNYTKFDFNLQTNYTYSRNFRIMINYFIIIKRLYR